MNLNAADDRAGVCQSGVLLRNLRAAVDFVAGHGGSHAETGIGQLKDVELVDFFDIDDDIRLNPSAADVVNQVCAASQRFGAAVVFGEDGDGIGQTCRGFVLEISHGSASCGAGIKVG